MRSVPDESYKTHVTIQVCGRPRCCNLSARAARQRTATGPPVAARRDDGCVRTPPTLSSSWPLRPGTGRGPCPRPLRRVRADRHSAQGSDLSSHKLTMKILQNPWSPPHKLRQWLHQTLGVRHANHSSGPLLPKRVGVTGTPLRTSLSSDFGFRDFGFLSAAAGRSKLPVDNRERPPRLPSLSCTATIHQPRPAPDPAPSRAGSPALPPARPRATKSPLGNVVQGGA